MTPRSPSLHAALRGFALGSFSYLVRELDDAGRTLPFAFEEHVQRRGPTLYEYRPLVRGFIEEHESMLRRRDDAVLALEELRRQPAAAIYARAHAGKGGDEDDALFRTVLLESLVRTAEACGGFDWDDIAFDRDYVELERTMFGERRTYQAVAPLVGISVGVAVELGPGLRVRATADGELTRHWPESRGLVPPGFGREADRYCVVELRSALGADDDVPDAPGEIADAVSAIRLATAAPVAAGPVLFETLDGRPYGVRPVLPIAATAPPGEASRLDAFRGGLAAEILGRLGLADADTPLAEALDRWELSLFQHEPFRSEQARASLAALLGGTWPLRSAVLLEPEPAPRETLHRHLIALGGGRGRDRRGARRGQTRARRGAPGARPSGARRRSRPPAPRARLALPPRRVVKTPSRPATSPTSRHASTNSARTCDIPVTPPGLPSSHGGGSADHRTAGADRSDATGGCGPDRAARRASLPPP